MISIGTAHWSIPKASTAEFPLEGRHLERYSRVMRCVEINSSFYRPHRMATYARWAGETPAGFRFSVKLPKAITHEARLVDVDGLLDTFLAEVAGLGDKLGVLLVQLPPSSTFVAKTARSFFESLRKRHAGPIACEPRHASWFIDGADRVMQSARVTRVAADPASMDRAAEPGGWLGEKGDGRGASIYYRWHGSPRMYWSAYEDAWIAERAARMSRWPDGTDCWCIFDNTAAGAALADALTLRAMFNAEPDAMRRTP